MLNETNSILIQNVNATNFIDFKELITIDYIEEL